MAGTRVLCKRKKPRKWQTEFNRSCSCPKRRLPYVCQNSNGTSILLLRMCNKSGCDVYIQYGSDTSLQPPSQGVNSVATHYKLLQHHAPTTQQQWRLQLPGLF